MQLADFAKLTSLADAVEIEKVRLLAYYHYKTALQKQFSLDDIEAWFDKLNLHKPNLHRLKAKLRESDSFIKGKEQESWRLHATSLDELQAQYPGLVTDTEEVVSTDAVLPHPVYENTRGFIESLAKQINASYEYNIFDGCAVLMRRLLEVLLILSYEHLGIEAEIQGTDGVYLPLEKIVANAKANTKLKLSRGAKATMEEFRTLGNFSAHKIYFTCRKADLKNAAGEYRATIEELLYKAGIRK